MTRVDENREAQRLDEKHRLEKQDAEKLKGNKEQFGKLVAQKQQSKGEANRTQPQLQGAQRGEKGRAENALMARSGIQSNRFAAELQAKGGDSLSQGSVQAKSRDEESRESRRSGEAQQTEVDGKRMAQQEERAAPVSRDDRQHRGDGDSSGGPGSGSGQGGDLGGPATGRTEAPKSTASTKGATLPPRIPPEVIQQIVSRVMVGVNKEGLSEFHIQFKENVLAGSSLQLSVKDGKVSATFHTPDSNVRRLLKASEGELARAFSAKGLSLHRLEVEGP